MAIRVVVRKRPISRSELGKNEIEVLEVFPRGKVLVHEPKTKVGYLLLSTVVCGISSVDVFVFFNIFVTYFQVDLTKVVETQEFIFDDAFDSASTNEEIYRRSIRSLVATMFEGGKGSCFAYGQTGAG